MIFTSSYKRLIVLLALFALIQFRGEARSVLANSQTPQAELWIDSVMNSLSLREKIAQLFMVAAYSNRDQEHVDEIADLVKKEKIGGLCFFQGGPVGQAQLTNHYQSLADVPLLISMDAEWGLGMRLDSTISYPRQMMLGAMDDNRLIYHMGADIARQLKRMGVHVNFAPVIDINNNPNNPVINTRAFGEDKEMVTQKGLAYMLGLQDNGIIACAKHFPGHGDTDTDSHYDLPLLNHSLDRIDTLELYPFKKLIESGVASVMVAHLEIPQLESQAKYAASLSYNVVSSLLIEELGFNGLIITDALNMKGVSDFYKPVELNYLALKAGNDVILFPSEVKASINKIEREVKRGRFPEKEIDRRCRKIIEAKYRVGLNNYNPIEIKGLIKDLNLPSSELLIRDITKQAITVLNNNDDIFPLQNLDMLNIAYLEIGNTQGTAFKEQLELYAPIATFSLNGNATEEKVQFLKEHLKSYNLIIVGYHSINSSPKNDFGITPLIAEFIEELALEMPTILTLFGTPYALGKFSNLNTTKGLIVAYDNSPITQNLTAQLIFGGIDVSGRLPVSINSRFAIGSGNDAGKQIRLTYSIPEDLNLSSKTLNKIDSIALDAIAQQAAPGMQILAAKNGVIFYNKCFGNHTYTQNDIPVNHSSIYDVASLTKVASTLLLTMDLYSKEMLSLESNLGNYLCFPDTSMYNELVISDILLHQAGLTPWIPFYLRTLQSLFPDQTLRNGKLSNGYPYQLGPNSFLNKHSYTSRKFYRNSYSYQYPHEVAKNLFAIEGIKDSIFSWIIKSPLGKKGTYVYSDLGFILLHRVIGNISCIPQEEYLVDSFYRGLGMNRTLFNPLSRFNEENIVPTENDVYFRKQLLWGHVHDPAAAMMGGITGHAGLFSTANDLAKLLQMYLNKGEYGGTRYLPASTIDLFTSCVNCHNGIRRGLGFDKPETDPKKASPVSLKATSLSYGHSGFTGVLAWVDPAYDLVYIFISNRIHPDADNRKLITLDVRTKIQDILYEAILESENIY
jgi:beta-glucosidase-like glycosyl hydrolase/CubicO group peptidase (beta-lactamase class C family)